MTHKRTEIREYLTAKLLAANTAAEDRVYNSKVLSDLGPFPCVALYTIDEQKTERTTTAPEYRKQVTIELQLVIKKNDSYAADLDDFCEEVEALLDFDYYLGGRQDGIVESFEPLKTEIMYNDKADEQLAMAMMTYQATYIAQIPDITSSLDKFNTFHGDIDTANDPTTEGELGPDGQIDAEIHITGLNP